MAAPRAQFVRIVWYDAQDAHEAWIHIDDEPFIEWMDELCTVVSYGYLIKKTKHYYVIAADLCGDHSVGRVTKIPRPWILNIRQLPKLAYREK